MTGCTEKGPDLGVRTLGLVGLLAVTSLLAPITGARAEETIVVRPVIFDRSPAYGSFTPVSGRWYGRARVVRSSEHAARLLRSFYGPRGLGIRGLREHPLYFEASVTRGI